MLNPLQALNLDASSPDCQAILAVHVVTITELEPHLDVQDPCQSTWISERMRTNTVHQRLAKETKRGPVERSAGQQAVAAGYGCEMMVEKNLIFCSKQASVLSIPLPRTP